MCVCVCVCAFVCLFFFSVRESNRKADIALIGLAVMGQNLILNMDQNGFVVCAFNRTVDKVRKRHENVQMDVCNRCCTLTSGRNSILGKLRNVFVRARNVCSIHIE